MMSQMNYKVCSSKPWQSFPSDPLSITIEESSSKTTLHLALPLLHEYLYVHLFTESALHIYQLFHLETRRPRAVTPTPGTIHLYL
jgi:hypothetical protein